MTTRPSTLRSRSRRWLTGGAGAAAIIGVAIASPHAADAAPAPEVFAGFDNADSLVGTTPRTNTILVPSGAYAITAKAYVSGSGGSSVDVRCQLNAGNDFDVSQTTVSSGRKEALALTVVHSFAGTSPVTLSCKNLSSATTQMSFVKIVATRANGLSNLPM